MELFLGLGCLFGGSIFCLGTANALAAGLGSILYLLVIGILVLVVDLLLLALLMSACTISYRFNGASIDYETTKTIQIDNFPIRSAYVWAPMQSIFQNNLTDIYTSQTKLRQVKKNGDLQLAGEIIAFDQYNKGISSDGYSSQVQLKMTVNVRFVNNKKHTDDFERQFTATTDYDSSQQLTAVQEELVTQMVKDIVDQIFNATVANW